MENMTIGGAMLKEMFLTGAALLEKNRAYIDSLNVFPVPDGDTGTNMSMTMQSAVKEIQNCKGTNVSDIAAAASLGALKGARGNSGVILSQILRGFARALSGKEEMAPENFAAALTTGTEAAYKAVMKPAEGTILTVSRMAAAAAVEAANAGASLESCLDCAIKAGNDALAETVNQNPVLKKAGVIDAGGQGYMYILGAMLASYRGEITAPENVDEIVETEKESSAFDVFDTEDIPFAFDTVFIVRKHDPDVDLEPLRKYLTSIGDSLVIGEDDEAFKVHVHTNIPGNALNEAQNFGTLELAKIENMRTQHDDILAGKHVQTTDDLDAIERELEEGEEQYCKSVKDYGVVTVCAGKGLEGLFKELGADGIVTGGQTMNPSTDDILKEINRTPANTVFVLPNNKNIIMAAEQCVRLSDKKVIIIPTRTVPQGISAMLNFNPEETEENLIAAMNEAAGNVHTAMVTYAARDSDFDGHEIHAGEYLALLDGALLGSYSSEKTLFKELSWAFDELSPEFITVYYGSDVAEDKANEAAETIIGCFPDAEVSVVNGGQPVYYYMISVE